MTKAKCTPKQVRRRSIARGQPWFPDVQASASEAQVERRYDPKRADGSRKSAKAVAEARERRAAKNCPKAAKGLRTWPPLGMPKAAKMTPPPRRPLNCESGPPLKTLLPPVKRPVERIQVVVQTAITLRLHSRGTGISQLRLR